jgi:hypothetical protein
MENVRDMLNHRETKGLRDEKLQKMSQELGERKESLKNKKLELESKMTKAIERFECLASSRQVYRELEEKNIALQTAKKGAQSIT